MARPALRPAHLRTRADWLALLQAAESAEEAVRLTHEAARALQANPTHLWIEAMQASGLRARSRA